MITLCATTINAQQTDTIPNFDEKCVLQSSGYFNPHYPQGYSESEGKGDTLIVFSPKTPIRKKAAVDAEILERVPIGEELIVIRYVETKSTIDGVEAPWCEVKYKGKKGFIWTGALTKGSITLPDGSSVCWGLARITNEEDNYARIASVRRYQDGELLQRLETDISYASEENSGELHLWCPPQLDDVENVIVLSTYGEACGLYSTDSYFTWDGNMIRYVDSGYGMGDGGVLYDSRNVLFPYMRFARPEQRYTLYAYPEENQLMISESNGELTEDCEWQEYSKVKFRTWPDLLPASCE